MKKVDFTVFERTPGQGDWYWNFRWGNQKPKPRYKQRAVNPYAPDEVATTPAEALRFAGMAFERVKRGLPPVDAPSVNKPSHTLASVIEKDYLPWYAATHPHSKADGAYQTKLLIEAMGSLPLAQFNREQAKVYHDLLQAKLDTGEWASADTARLHQTRAQAVFTYLGKEGKDNPFYKVQGFKRRNRPPKIALTFAEEQAFMEACYSDDAQGKRDLLAHWIAIQCEVGCRVAEFLRALKVDVDSQARPPVIVLRNFKKGQASDGDAKERIVPISDYALPHVQALLLLKPERKDEAGNAFLWPHTGEPRRAFESVRRSVSQRFPRLARFQLRWCRHTFRTRVEGVGLGARPTEAGYFTGHAPEMAQYYVIPDLQRAHGDINEIRRRRVVSIQSQRHERTGTDD